MKKDPRLFLENREPLRSDLNSVLRKAAFCNPETEFQECVSCVMDTTDPFISFNESGVCSYCLSLTEKAGLSRLDTPEKRLHLERVISEVKRKGEGRDFDVVIGMSGGVDSSFLLSKIIEWGLRPLPVHIDAGWNSDLAVGNISKLVNQHGLDLLTVVINWESMRRLQSAFLKSGLANLDIPQDHVFTTSVLEVARKYGVPSIFSGSNISTESILPSAWGYDSLDGLHIKAVFRRFGDGRALNLPIWSSFKARRNLSMGTAKVYSPLNDIPYDRNTAVAELGDTYGWQDYGGKHYESRWTKFFQSFVLPYRFGYDKRKAHLSSRILNGEISREDAISELSRPVYEMKDKSYDIGYVANKLGMTAQDVESAIERPLSHYSDFPNGEERLRRIYLLARPLRPIVRILKKNR